MCVHRINEEILIKERRKLVAAHSFSCLKVFMSLVRAALFFMTPVYNLAREATVFLPMQTRFLLQY